ncbi:MAG TPA: thioredoxin family protein [Ktedonobacteraceae bacterium]
MAFISPQDYQTLQELFARELQHAVSIIYFTQHESVLTVPGQECAYCKDTRALLEEVVTISDKLHLTVKDFVRDEQEAQRLGIERIPACILQGQARGTVRFFGVPAGYEFATLVEDLIDVSKGTTDFSEKTRKAISEIDQNPHLQVFVTPTCPYCPRAARLAHKLAIENPHVTADVVEVSEFIDLAQRYYVQGVPKTVVNDRTEFVGALPEPRFLQEVLKALQPAQEQRH